MNNSVTRDLLERLAQGQGALFIAESYTSGASSEQALAAELAGYCNYDRPEQELSRVADYFEIMSGRQSLIQRTIDWVDRVRREPTLHHKLLTALPFGVIITTSFDTRLEEAFRRADKPLAKVIRDSDVSFGDGKQVTLIKVCGCVEQPETLVLTERDHRTFQRRHPLIANQLKVIYASKTLIFLNYDLQRDYLREFHEETIAGIRPLHRTAYAVTPQSDEFTRRYWAKDNIVVIAQGAEAFLQNAVTALPKTLPAIAPRRAIVIPNLATPYKYLDYFETADEGLFFGRGEEVLRLSRRILASRQSVLFGGSGFGKTSLIKAGLMPEIARLGYLPIYSRCLDNPIVALERAIDDAVRACTGCGVDSEDQSASRLLSIVARAQQVVGQQLVLFVDQLEEIFRLSFEQQQNFVIQIARVITNDHVGLRVVFALRDDFFPELESWQGQLPAIYHHFFRLGRLTESAATESIVGPLGFCDVKFEDKLVELLIEDLRAEGSIEPAQLQIVCSRLYEHFAAEQIITVEHYAQLGRAQAIFRAYFEDVIGRLTASRRVLANRLLQELVSTSRTKLLRTAAELASGLDINLKQIEPLLVELENSRLIRRLQTDDDYKYEIIHDHIVQQVWETFTDDEVQIKQVREMLRYEAIAWLRYRTPLNQNKLADIYRYWMHIQFEERELELIFRSSLTFGKLKLWHEVTAARLSQLKDMYVRLLGDDNRDVTCAAAVLLHAQAEDAAWLSEVLIKVRDVHQHEVRKTLRQFQQGRSVEAFTDEIDNSNRRKRRDWRGTNIIGIDFGTGSSAVAVIESGDPIIIPNQEGSKFTPSVVAFTHRGEIVVGTPALLQAPVNPERTVFSIKRQLGTTWSLSIDGKIYGAVEIAAIIINYLKAQAEAYLQQPVTQTVIAAPAYFSVV
ncbi:hypothetical protein CJ255_00320 [Candidatus Viridilinea mediisalina]|uniref:Novel STAND NTPase 1 domain-containing protein n=1 Tax=Candidatus Viridilinea mediisalina TaxID=2024553 RepID=A0A2A6RQ68_9CHLR|nr:hypothetical protein CJ255_00320 [Candidatus Viridilinea mediisalina]